MKSVLSFLLSVLLGTLPSSSPAVVKNGSRLVLGIFYWTSDALSPLISDAYPATTPCFDVPLCTAAAVNPVKLAEAGRTTHPLHCFSSPLANDTLTAYSTIPKEASLFRNAKELTFVLRISSACRSTSRKLGMPGAGGNVVTNEFSWNTNSVCEPASQAVPSAVQTREASHTVPGPRLPWVTHGTFSHLLIEETRVVVAESSRGSGQATTVGAAREDDVVTGEAAAAPVCRGLPLAVNRVVHVGEDIAKQSSDIVSSHHFPSLLVR